MQKLEAVHNTLRGENDFLLFSRQELGAPAAANRALRFTRAPHVLLLSAPLLPGRPPLPSLVRASKGRQHRSVIGAHARGPCEGSVLGFCVSPLCELIWIRVLC